MICPVCGALMFTPEPAYLFKDKEFNVPEDKVLSGCLCWVQVEELENAYQVVKETLARTVREHLYGETWDEILEEVGQMAPGTPIREFVLRKRTLLTRARDKIQELRGKEAETRHVAQAKKTARKKGISGKELSLREFMDSFDPK